MLALTAPASAQDHDDALGSREPAIVVNGVVTTQHRPQNQVEVPIALTTFSGEFLDDIGVEDFEELARFVPGFEVQNQSPVNPGFVMRGITSDSGVSFNEPRVSIFQDGVSISRVRGSFVELFDLERVEIAKGPQSTLHGRSALTGAVNLVQNKADPQQRAGSFRAEVGNFGYWLSEAMGNLPLGDSAALRLSGRYRSRDGIVENLLDGEDFGSINSAAARASLRFEPSDRLTFDLIGNYQHDEAGGTPFVSLTRRQTDPSGRVLAPLDRFGGAALRSSASLEEGRPLGIEREVEGVTGLGEYRFSGALTLNTVTGWRQFRSLEVLDADGLSLPILSAADEGRGRQFSQDLRLRFDQGGLFSGFLGASYFRDSGSQRVATAFDERVLLAQLAGSLNGRIPGRPETDPAPLALLRNTGAVAQLLQGLAASRGAALPGAIATAIAANLKPDHLEQQTNFARTRAWDVFADATLRPTDKLELTAGVRYTHERKRSGISSELLTGRSILAGFAGAIAGPVARRDALIRALALPGAANLPATAAFPLFGVSQPTTGNGQRFDEAHRSDGFSYRANARFAPDPRTSVYVSYARGRRPEVLTAQAPNTPGGPAIFEVLPSETVDSFEVGAKSMVVHPQLFLAGSLFHYRYGNFRTTEQVGTSFIVTNAGKARSTGFEGEISWRASDGLDLFGTYAYNRSRFRSGARRGNRFRLSPDHSLAIGGLARAPLGSGLLTLSPTLTYQSKTFFASDNDRPELQQRPAAVVPDNIQDEFQNGYALVNARLGYAPADERWRVEAFVENLFNKAYLKDAGNTGDSFGLPTGVRGTPRTVGVSLRFGFADEPAGTAGAL